MLANNGQENFKSSSVWYKLGLRFDAVCSDIHEGLQLTIAAKVHGFTTRQQTTEVARVLASEDHLMTTAMMCKKDFKQGCSDVLFFLLSGSCS